MDFPPLRTFHVAVVIRIYLVLFFFSLRVNPGRQTSVCNGILRHFTP